MGVYNTVRPLTLAEPCAGVVDKAMLVTLPVMVGVIALFVLFAATVVLFPVMAGAGGVTVRLIVALEEVPPGPAAVIARLSVPLYPAFGVYNTFKPLSVAEPCKGAETMDKLLAVPVMLGTIVLFVLFAATVALVDATDGGGGVTVMLISAAAEVPPGPVAVIEKLSGPL